MIIRSKNLYLPLVLIPFAFILSGCLEQETTGDSTQREFDRQKIQAHQIETVYAQMTGTFRGTSGASDVELTLETNPGKMDGNLVAQPQLVGQLTYFPRILVDDAGKAMPINYTVTGGEFDGSSDLSLTITPPAGNPSLAHCTVTNLNRLDCHWFSSYTAKFTVTRAGSGQALTGGKDIRLGSGVYVGENADYSRIAAHFRALETTNGSSQSMPQLSIVGNISFVQRADPNKQSRQIGFSDGQFDPSDSKMVIRLNGDNPIVLNCIVSLNTDLHCVWSGAHNNTGFEDFDLKKDQQ